MTARNTKSYARRWSWWLITAATTAIVCQAAPQSLEISAEKNQTKPVERYRILWERNVFDSHRAKAKPADSAQAAEKEHPVEQIERVVLTGVFLVGGTNTAFFEGTLQAYNVHGVEGAKVGNFDIAKIGIDAVVLKLEGTAYELPLGGDLKKDSVSGWLVESTADSLVPPEDSPTEAKSNRSDRHGSVLEKLKARRQGEQKK